MVGNPKYQTGLPTTHSMLNGGLSINDIINNLEVYCKNMTMDELEMWLEVKRKHDESMELIKKIENDMDLAKIFKAFKEDRESNEQRGSK